MPHSRKVQKPFDLDARLRELAADYAKRIREEDASFDQKSAWDSACETISETASEMMTGDA
jgi:hypothetical protein